jgi:hypothetical protein
MHVADFCNGVKSHNSVREIGGKEEPRAELRETKVTKVTLSRWSVYRKAISQAIHTDPILVDRQYSSSDIGVSLALLSHELAQQSKETMIVSETSEPSSAVMIRSRSFHNARVLQTIHCQVLQASCKTCCRGCC